MLKNAQKAVARCEEVKMKGDWVTPDMNQSDKQGQAITPSGRSGHVRCIDCSLPAAPQLSKLIHGQVVRLESQSFSRCPNVKLVCVAIPSPKGLSEMVGKTIVSCESGCPFGCPSVKALAGEVAYDPGTGQ